ncbi:alkaline phosphatase D family protein [Neptunitalea lumnitzerae]|uniref:Alkaline phosphatase n=1 Tax=Neptunitalea lumnitzerae TaxID=2965509 RepID=A0ABQ5MLF5_9FLAO|nr:alkaline phosphatase D family protein [Neptunitalea sp. Y10]GLB50182.1 alkaline phosphatase [Neptunitalea sp. Y10]
MSQKNNSRRNFIYQSLLATGGIILASNFISCKNDDDTVPSDNIPDNLALTNFDYGVASFDPTASQVIIWTRYSSNAANVVITWQVASDEAFENVIRSGEVTTTAERDYTVAVEVQDLDANQKLYYRFIQLEEETVSPVGETLTFPENASEVTIAICSCSNYPAGLFNVYKEMANSDADVIVHLGDYIYEYGENEYGTNEYTAALGRTHNPTTEILDLEDYRTRYKQYRSDSNLQHAHQKKPFICVWDDHEVSNDTYKDGAENHQSDEGSFEARKAAAIQAYSEFVPVRTEDATKIYRSFNIGNLINLIMLDTRVIGRDKQLSYFDYLNTDGSIDAVAFQTALYDTNRTMLGTEQRNWLLSEVASNSAQWQVIGQQVLMGKMLIPMELLLSMNTLLIELETTGSVSDATFATFTNTMTELVTLKYMQLNGLPLTAEETARIETVAPYNLDAWDGYPYEREILLNAFENKNVVCLAGDTHNSWASALTRTNTNGENVQVAQEFATTSVSSPGFESYLGLAGGSAISSFEQAITTLIDDLSYVDASRRGFVKITFTAGDATAQYTFVDNVNSEVYTASVAHTVSYNG